MDLKDKHKIYIAHKSDDGLRIQTVKEHLDGTGKLAKKFGSSFGCDELAEILGQFHDIGKYSDEFQMRIRGRDQSVDHSTAGAKVMYDARLPEAALAIAGHHGGIPDLGNASDTSADSTLIGRYKRRIPDCSAWKEELTVPKVSSAIGRSNGFSDMFYTRMLYSCLVDADYLDTENFMTQGTIHREPKSSIHELLQMVEQRANLWLNKKPDGILGKMRNEVLRSCIKKADSDRGIFTLTVPTGGGKTFSSLAFALNHASRNNMDRVIYVMPYTSIIDQTVDVFDEILGKDNVLAHYSSAEYLMKEDCELSENEYKKVLASENWDAPVIVTTAVQFFESLFSNRPSRCRKLHNIANSTIIFDEAQTIPIDYLSPCLSSMACLVRSFRSTIVLCTATQPEFSRFFSNICPEIRIHEISPNIDELYRALKRLTVINSGSTTTNELGEQLANEEQVLCVVNKRKTAKSIYEKLPESGSFCLTTLLCAADRRSLISEIRDRLNTGRPCRVVSTSLIEAGVDIDFPIAFREETGLDSILQTAGRCNREGKRSAEASNTFIFTLTDETAPKMLGQNLNALHYVERECPDSLQSPKAIGLYFNTLYNVKNSDAMDKKHIIDISNSGCHGILFPFREVAEQFRLIEDNGKTIYIPIGEGASLCEQLKVNQVSSKLFRRLGVYSVRVHSEHYQNLYDAGKIISVDDFSGILNDLNLYSCKTGLNLTIESQTLII